ncbi:hypothetical protein KIH87_19260 [Paraneptunicella aestuarii]|uniref:hypothetical protein n=1 Tax=Paraneptunicella aestuarii TaxID=2831148 RepID=UPI001E5346E6|nr:hypothetical protein [Paraneptunicella aestuarii]UAA38768.1 hypothetical protein KIH87_19260 [Paraneptunicella aestuarii]
MTRFTKRTTFSTLLLCTSILAGCSTTGTSSTSHKNTNNTFQATEQFYDSIVAKDDVDIAKLNLFMTKMPKGGDIHHHYSGTIYAETYLDWVENKNWRIDSCTLTIVKDDKPSGKGCAALTVAELLAEDALFRKLLTLWSDKDYDNHYHDQPPPDSNFFNTFGYFGPIADEYADIGVQIIKQRALKENVTYIETMYSRVAAKAKNFYSASERAELIQALRNVKTQEQANALFDKISQTLSSKAGFNQAVSDFVNDVANIHQNIDDDNFTMRYQTYTARVQDPLQVFTELYSGFIASNQSPLIVGVNIVAPENNYVALMDYTLHMQMYNYLHHKFPKVNRALHAGELTLGMVRPKDLMFHIKEARDIAKAERIGHGIDLPYETHSLELLEDLKQNAAIEINLTSNEFILGVEGQEHPYLIYSAYGVPMVISTDDSGVSRNNLTNEFVLLASRYQPSYSKIKEYVYNSIRYSFMSEADKATNLKRLDEKFEDFEAEMAKLASKMTN